MVTVVKRKDAGIAPGSPEHVTTIPVDGLFGVYDLLSGPFVAVIRRSKLRCAGRGEGAEGARAGIGGVWLRGGCACRRCASCVGCLRRQRGFLSLVAFAMPRDSTAVQYVSCYKL